MENFKGLAYEAYYDELGNYCIEINKANAEELIKRITGAKEVKIL